MVVIRFGKNAKENEKLSNSIGGKDYWFHARDCPGSHVVLKGTPLETDIIHAARLAATHSKSKELNTAVIVARGIDIFKPDGFPIGTICCKKSTFMIVTKL